MIRSILRRLRADLRGAALVEFAFLAPVIILLLAGAVELGRLAMIKSSLEAAVATAARAALVDLEAAEEDRDEDLRERIAAHMSPFATFPGREMNIETKVYRSFGDSYPESYEDTNGNGRYDGPSGSFAGEPFEDRNRNGVRDLAIQKAGLLGGAGDVVLYKVDFPVALMFDFLAVSWLKTDGIELSSTVVVRNEPVTPPRARVE